MAQEMREDTKAHLESGNGILSEAQASQGNGFVRQRLVRSAAKVGVVL